MNLLTSGSSLRSMCFSFLNSEIFILFLSVKEPTCGRGQFSSKGIATCGQPLLYALLYSQTDQHRNKLPATKAFSKPTFITRLSLEI